MIILNLWPVNIFGPVWGRSEKPHQIDFLPDRLPIATVVLSYRLPMDTYFSIQWMYIFSYYASNFLQGIWWHHRLGGRLRDDGGSQEKSIVFFFIQETLLSGPSKYIYIWPQISFPPDCNMLIKYIYID